MIEHFWNAFSRHWRPFQALNCPIGAPWGINTPQISHSESLRSSFEGQIFEVRKISVVEKKNDNFTIGNHRAQETWDIRPSGGAGASAQCPHAPVTMHYNTCGRCRDALPGHYLCCSSQDKCNARPSAQDGGGSSIPSGRRRILVQGHPRPPPSHARAAILLQCQIKGNH